MAIAMLCQPGVAGAAEPELPGVDLKDLDKAETKLLVSILEEQFDPCGKPRSFLESVQDEGSCKLASQLANFTVGQIQRGLSKRQVVRALIKEQKRLTQRHEFTVDERPAVGPADAKVTVVEFFDFQCPHCKIAAKAVPKLVKKKKGVRLVYKQYPLEFHPAARTAAIAALAAHKQGKWSAVHDKLFENQDSLDDETVAKLVRSSGLDMERFAKDSQWASDLLAADKREGDAAGVDGTPSFYVNGRRVEYEELEAAIDEALAEKK